uniref:NADH dehydrogenase subunit 9 n=1 Tax=Cafileria marina TaxID=2557541 RepID=A0A5B9IQ26_9STRA|nr:NADH dehydrogenase subunit 9 [Cafileria marina]QEF30250.1 NADH dehydrogenase subunit 9 [Cafileria marina]
MKKLNTYNKTLINYSIFIKKIFPSVKLFINKNELFIKTKKDLLYTLILFLKKNTNSRFDMLIDICAVDYPEKKFRFEIIYNLLSIQYNTRINVIINIEDNIPVKSITSIYKNANWLEREVWDMFGIFFFDNNDLRRILTDYGFKGHPLRKDFPLSGYTETLYNDFDKKLSYQEVSLTQIYRNFNISSI